MGKINVFTLLATIIMQVVVGYLWYGTHLFGDVITTGGGHAVDFLQTDVLSILLVILSSYGLTHIMETMMTGVKDIHGVVKTGLTLGVFGIGLPITMLLNLMGFSHIVLLVVFTHVVLVTILTGIIVLKLKK
jgi:hypothetical protein